LLLVHNPEQHRDGVPPSAAGAPLAVHGLPAVRQVVVSGTHFPPAQFWLQHPAEVVQLWLSATQLGALAQTPRAVSHCRLQQSVASRHELPDPLHTVTDDLHFLVTVSQMFEQHWLLPVHASSATVHTTPEPPEPGVPPSVPSAPRASLGVPCPEPRLEQALSARPHSESTITSKPR